MCALCRKTWIDLSEFEGSKTLWHFFHGCGLTSRWSYELCYLKSILPHHDDRWRGNGGGWRHIFISTLTFSSSGFFFLAGRLFSLWLASSVPNSNALATPRHSTFYCTVQFSSLQALKISTFNNLHEVRIIICSHLRKADCWPSWPELCKELLANFKRILATRRSWRDNHSHGFLCQVFNI